MGESVAVSILFESPEATPVLERERPSHFADLNLDQVVDSAIAGREGYDLAPFFYTPLPTRDSILYRHEVLRDLQSEALFSHVSSFAKDMQEMRKGLAHGAGRHYQYEKQAWFLDAGELYCEAVGRLARELASIDVRSRGLRAFGEYLTNYVGSQRFTALCAETKQVKEALASVRYCLNIKGRRVKVTKYESEPDYGAEVARTFERFKHGGEKDYRVGFRSSLDMNHVEARVLELVAQLHPEVFAALDDYCERHQSYLDDAIGAFDREVQFYVSYLEYIERLTADDLPFCYPQISERDDEVYACDAFDIALANKLVPEGAAVVSNDFYLTDPERIIVVTGPNQGGKTTFARMVGQLHHLASIGCLVPGSDVQLSPFDQLFTHFEREEDITSLSGKLEDDLLRVHDILDRATRSSIVIMNESFTSTTLQDALLLGRAVIERMIELRLLCVYVSFADELASLGEATVSMVSSVLPDDPTTRTYKITRRPADGLAYAAALAEKYGLTYERLKERTPS